VKKPVAIGIDLGGTNCRGALVSPSGQVSGWRSIETDSTVDLTVFLKRLTVFCQELRTAAADMGLSVVGVGCGAAGVVDPSGQIRSAPNIQLLNGFDLQSHLKRELNLPALVINDANAIAWGEARYGGGQPFDSFLTITLGTGVGGGLILHRQLWQGKYGGAGEIGHLAVEVEGRPCGCGSHGCLEQYASGQGIIRNFQELGGDRGGNALDSFGIADLARQGDPLAQKAFDLAGRYLGQGIAGVVNLLNLESVLFAGGLSGCLDLLQPSLEQELSRRAFAVNRQQLHLVKSCLADRAGILGTASLLFDRLENH
jgi:glucokinase